MSFRQQPLLLAVLAALTTLGTATARAETTLATVDVQAERDDFDQRQTAPSTRLVYGREELDRMNELTVGDYLRRLPGVTFTGPPGAPKDVRLRGMDKGYTQILIDGEPVPGGGKERQIQVDRLPLDLVERIEIIRVPTADLPNEGLVGTINLVLRDAPHQSVASARLVGGRVFGEKADGDNTNLSAQMGGATESVRWLLNGSVGQRNEVKTKSKDDQKFTAATSVRNAWTQEFEDERTRSDGFDFAPRVNVKLGGGELVLSPFVSRTDEEKRKTTTLFKFNTPASGANYVANGEKREAEDKLREIARLRGEWKQKLGGGNSLAIYAAAQEGGEEKQKTTHEFNAAGGLTKLALEDATQDEEEWFVGARGKWALVGQLLSGGIEFGDKSRQDRKTLLENGVLKANGLGDSIDLEEDRRVAHLQDEIALSADQTLIAGVRWQQLERQALDSVGGERFDRIESTSPSLHYVWRIDGRNNLRASLAETIKPPKFDEITGAVVLASGVNSASNTDKAGNTELRPEKAIGAELGWEHFLPRSGGVIGANLFYRDIDDKVEKRTVVEGGRFVERPYNVGHAQIWGAEFDARARLDLIGAPQVMLRFNATLLDSRLENTSTGTTTKVKDQPPYVYNVGFDWQLTSWDGAWGLNYNFTPQFVKDPATPANRDDEAEQKLLDLYVYQRIDRNLGVRFTAANLLDMKKDKFKRTYDTLGRLTGETHEIEQGGVAVALALEGKW